LTSNAFLNEKEYSKKEIWELAYIDTSEDEDDESSESEEEVSAEESDEENKNKDNFIETEAGEKLRIKNESQISMKFSDKAPGSKGD